MWVRPASATPTVQIHGPTWFWFIPFFYLTLQFLYPSFIFHLPPSLVVMHIINPYDRYASDNASSPANAPSRTRISFSRKAAPVVSITPTSAISTGQENRSPTSCVAFPSSPQIPPTETCHDPMYIPRSVDLFSTPEQPENVPPAHAHHRQRSNSGLMSIQQRSSSPLATLNSGSRARVGFIDLGKSTAVLSITTSGTVSRVEHHHLNKTLAITRQRRLDRKRSASMITRKQTKKASVDSKFLVTLHHSITWHIENRPDEQGPSFSHCYRVQSVRGF